VLREFDKGNIDLFTPIKKYLPELTQSWADTVTIHHLLTHMHGISQLDKPTTFKVGTQYSYSQIGYELLAKIIERTSGKSFAELSRSTELSVSGVIVSLKIELKTSVLLSILHFSITNYTLHIIIVIMIYK